MLDTVTNLMADEVPHQLLEHALVYCPLQPHRDVFHDIAYFVWVCAWPSEAPGLSDTGAPFVEPHELHGVEAFATRAVLELMLLLTSSPELSGKLQQLGHPSATSSRFSIDCIQRPPNGDKLWA
eukprot:CAMPEP_0171075784 /NCGR_PEP_ID=MMETSP0766_2-20121228/12995_1 /TAXON_ID=439317 /ORGANISM="Gambierdiscus australes, Strain CAWD 149" /LENGTH=123 /DNA_ID=CAMNT_0011532685 /DNA_START=412 /DNA_END=783 /DNA_ORIENTATION=-